MAPTLRHGDQLLVLRRRRAPTGALVVVRLPDDRLAVKRLVRSVDGGAIWVEGDNPIASTDSRSLGSLPANSVLGVPFARIWPRPRLLTRAAVPDRATRT
jgi:SOS-response transcriptional repressor LexA